MANSKRKCKYCSEFVEADTGVKVPAGFFCSFDHAIRFANEKTEKAKKRQANKAEKAKREKHREDKERVKTKAKWLSELQTLVNQCIRLRDYKDGCISCDKPAGWSGQWHAGHYYSRGHSASLRFNLWNINKQCSICNNHLSGNVGEYTPRLIEKIGQDRYDHLERHKSDPARYEIEYIKRAIKVARKAVKRYERKKLKNI